MADRGSYFRNYVQKKHANMKIELQLKGKRKERENKGKGKEI